MDWNVEAVDGSLVKTMRDDDSQGRTWGVILREGGSMSVFYTIVGVGAHFVVYDTLDINDAVKHRETVANVERLLAQERFDIARTILNTIDEHARRLKII